MGFQRVCALKLVPNSIEGDPRFAEEPAREAAKGNKDPVVAISADAAATHQSVITAMDVLGKMGFSQLEIATVQQTPPTNQPPTAPPVS